MTLDISSGSTRTRFIGATLTSTENAANSITFTIDPGAGTRGAASASYTAPKFYANVQIRDNTGALKTGTFPTTYARTGASAGILTIAKGTGTFATGDTVTVVGKLTYT
jgi:hypothetical protein